MKTRTSTPTTQRTYTVLLVLIAGLALVGCGSRNTSNSSDQASTNGVPDATDRGGASGKPAANCNKATKDDLQVQLMAYTDANGVRNNSLIHLKLAHVPAEYIGDGYDIEIRKWTASPTGVVRPADNEAKQYANVRFDYKSAGIYSPASNWNYNKDCSTCPSLDWYNMKLIAKANGTTVYTDPNAFFEKYHLLLDLEDPGGDWKALMVVITYQGAAVKYLNVLIPTFDANPADYQLNHAPVLYNLHPLLSMLNQGFPSTQYQTESNAFCF